MRLKYYKVYFWRDYEINNMLNFFKTLDIKNLRDKRESYSKN